MTLGLVCFRSRAARQSLRRGGAILLALALMGMGPLPPAVPISPLLSRSQTAPAAAPAASASDRDAEPSSRARARLNARVFDRVWNAVRRDYYDPTLHGLDWARVRMEHRPDALAAPDDARLYAVVNRMLALLDDAHASAFTPAVARRQDLLRRRHAILGLTLFPLSNGGYRIERVRSDSPAAAAGVQRGWRLEPAPEGWTPDRAVVAGEPVRLTFTDPQGRLHRLTIVARTMAPLPAFTADRSHEGALVLRAEGFEPGLGRWLGGQLSGLEPGTAVVLDLRSNPGGLLREADAALACFLPRGRAWARRTSRSGRVEVLRVASRCGILRAPVANRLAVLVDGSSRSAAELTPAALQEAGRAVVVGQKTAGAVLISREADLPGGGRLSLSLADFVTIDGVRLEKRGVTPDVAVAEAAPPDLPSQPDPALDAALTVLRAETIVEHHDPAIARAAP